MSTRSKTVRHDPSETPLSADQRVGVVCVVPEALGEADREVDLVGAFLLLWSNKLLILGVTAVFAILSIIYALTLTHWYRAEITLAPAEEKTATGIMGQLGGLASLAGLNSNNKASAEALAVMKSRDFIRGFIEDRKLLTVLFQEQWDASRSAWKSDNPEEWPDIREAVKFFDDNVLEIEQDRSTGLVTLAVYWKDPAVAAEWATALVKRLNARMRQQALEDAEENVAYLRNEMSSTTIVALQQSMGRLLEAELQKLMLARGNEEFAFRVIDSAEIPMTPSKPSRRLIVMLATVFGGLLACFIVYVREVARSYRANRIETTVDEEKMEKAEEPI